MDKIFLEDCLAKGMSTRKIEQICGKNNRTVSYWINKYEIQDQSKYKKSKNYRFDKIDTKEKAYVLGFILADGAINEKTTEISVALKDREIVDYIAGIIGGNVHIDNMFDKKTRRFPRIRLQKRIEDIKKFLGGYAKIDRHYPRVREDLERYLIQGFFDGDGCITWGRRKDKDRVWQKVSFNSQLKPLEGVQQYLLKNLSISTTIKPKGKEKCYILEFANKTDVLRFCQHIYPNEDYIILKRKYFKYNALRLELEENGESHIGGQYRAEPTE